MDEQTELWKQPLIRQKAAPVRELRADDPDFEAELSLQIEKRGYCLLCCHALGDAVIAVVAGGGRIPVNIARYPAYTVPELDMLAGTDAWTDIMVLEAKRAAGAVVTSVSKNTKAARRD